MTAYNGYIITLQGKILIKPLVFIFMVVEKPEISDHFPQGTGCRSRFFIMSVLSKIVPVISTLPIKKSYFYFKGATLLKEDHHFYNTLSYFFYIVMQGFWLDMIECAHRLNSANIIKNKSESEPLLPPCINESRVVCWIKIYLGLIPISTSE